MIEIRRVPENICRGTGGRKLHRKPANSLKLAKGFAKKGWEVALDKGVYKSHDWENMSSSGGLCRAGFETDRSVVGSWMMGTKLKASLLHPSFERCNWIPLFQWHSITHKKISYSRMNCVTSEQCALDLWWSLWSTPRGLGVNPGGLLKLNTGGTNEQRLLACPNHCRKSSFSPLLGSKHRFEGFFIEYFRDVARGIAMLQSEPLQDNVSRILKIRYYF